MAEAETVSSTIDVELVTKEILGTIERERERENHAEDVHHAFLRILGTYFDNFLAIGY